MLHVVWLKRDLRLYDHQPLYEAVQSGEPILPIYVAEPSIWLEQELSARHFQFVKESLMDLQKSFRQKGGNLFIAIGEMEEVLVDIHRTFGEFILHAHEENGTPHTYKRDLRVHDWMKERGLDFKEYQHYGVVRRLKSRDDFQAYWEQFMNKPLIPVSDQIPCVETNEVPDSLTDHLDVLKKFEVKGERIATGQVGGERRAHHTFNDFLDNRYESYHFHISKPMASAESCSRLSPYLSWGNLSMRYAVQKTREKMDDSPKGRKHLKMFMSRLHWHCHFIQRLEDDPTITEHAINPAFDQIRNEWNEEAFTRWYNGQTGIPMIDAAMRALHETGWVNFRSRAMVVSFVCNTLLLDWRKPGHALAGLFLDYEPGIHYSQIQMQSGTTGFNTIRIYNPVKQGRDHDPDGAFIKRFVPELRAIPVSFIHQPWELPNFSELDYPAPIVDIPSANKKARDLLWSVKQTDEAKSRAHKQLKKHGSRKRREKKRKQQTEEQLSLDLFE
ncbi:FAD-binding domain-containing protein [Halobacillus halophilus]|uniref:FAD-binding domain-containing protein n=1 Tax=Halobacillus halophilus TaxID=1570 RepID=UPI001CD59DE4|nr:deoxyribodipyrimidine photo-lyase [Halobacillus halophilus]MCA1010362.1 DNA photolyase family protein [Halobacillus halophilus]